MEFFVLAIITTIRCIKRSNKVLTQLDLFPHLPLVTEPYFYWKRYRTYLRSSLWKRVRLETLEKADHACQANKSPSCEGLATQVHHLTYTRWKRGADRPGIDTIAICGRCHCWIHAHPMVFPEAANDNDELQLQYEDTG